MCRLASYRMDQTAHPVDITKMGHSTSYYLSLVYQITNAVDALIPVLEVSQASILLADNCYSLLFF